MRKFILLFLVFSLIGISVYCQDAYKDPFRSLLPEDDAEVKKAAKGETKGELPSIAIQGVLWGSKAPQTVIDGEVYYVGDKLLNIDASVFKIEKNVVFISYGEKIFRLKVQKEAAGKKKAR